MQKDRTAQPPDVAALRRELGYIKEDEFFALLDIAKGTGRNRQSAGTLPPHYKTGKEKFYRLSEVEAWIRRRRVERGGA
jgi:predicted DNA-binding transcriptional regulator AlpA